MAEGLAVAGENPQGKVLRGFWKTQGTPQETPGKPLLLKAPPVISRKGLIPGSGSRRGRRLCGYRGWG
ncbi:hypothetical protein [Candidatus Caldatribacterium saccharofermentans]|uniref:hypothetical protein n=1 Tax=Candidatus Caldatribacterium saccharofermentans TaxID=1454753 RepID=UPI003CFD04EE